MKFVNALALLLAMAWAPGGVAQDGGRDCLVASESGRLPEGVRAIEPLVDSRLEVIRVACADNRVSGLTIKLVAGRSTVARILLVGGSRHAASLTGAGLPNAWVDLSARRIGAGTTLLTLSVEAPDSAEAGSTFSDILSVKRSGREFDIDVSLEVLDEGPLFRDEFDVDPMMGQFSLVM
ncbi:hypothetical protein [Wenzhouxiangella sediminis]|uniref:Secreted protein n=1 Tax=Wenzhouxiangella sediminis TaxID=1792836 RepID=A0A3E1KBZ3_9GAMM|nr:hypothetical protein [Wenzhouxiangella sediminis]RFF32019.1 hypothetical protein DZC52_03225 [Wenzhouxiangella sediminis]